MTIEQTIEITVDHRITLDLPPELPIGKTKVEMSFTPLFIVPPTQGSRKIHLSKLMIDELLRDEHLRSLTGLLHNYVSADEIRAERVQERFIEYDHID
jgi:hypothetical protein